MYVETVTIAHEAGLTARSATFFIQKASEFKSSIWLEKDGERVNAKSLLGVLALNVAHGTTVRIIADGPDEETAVNSLVSQASKTKLTE